MNHIKLFGLAAVAIAALVVSIAVGSASATVLCKEWKKPCPKGQDYPAETRIQATLEAKTTSVFRATGGSVLSTCTGGTMEGLTTNTGGAGEAVAGNFDGFWFEGCTNATKVTVNGRFEIKYIGPETFGGLTVKETEMTVSPFGVSCAYSAKFGYYFGTITSAKEETPTIHVNVILPKVSGGFLCPLEAVWEASYEITKPHPVYFKQEMAA